MASTKRESITWAKRHNEGPGTKPLAGLPLEPKPSDAQVKSSQVAFNKSNDNRTACTYTYISQIKKVIIKNTFVHFHTKEKQKIKDLNAKRSVEVRQLT